MKIINTTIFLVALVCITGSSFSEELMEPKMLIDKGACPFECCTYQNWHAENDTILRKSPSGHASAIISVQSGSEVLAITGEVHVKPGRFRVKNGFSRYKPGDLIWVYTYLGEGHFKVSFNGRMYEEELDFSPYGPSAYKSQFGAFLALPISEWWVKIKTKKGEVGWSNQPGNFSNKDACS